MLTSACSVSIEMPDSSHHRNNAPRGRNFPARVRTTTVTVSAAQAMHFIERWCAVTY